jgi:4-nitrophenyl phosphatase
MTGLDPRSAEDQRAWLDDLSPPPKGLILDADGVLWRDAVPIGDLPSIFACISDRGLRLTLATNNAVRTVDEYLSKLHSFGVSLEPWQVVTSAEAAADTLADRFPGRGRVFVVGGHGLVYALEQRGFHVVIEPGSSGEFAAVIAGMDRHLTYDKLRAATTAIRAGALFFGTNPDTTFPTPHGLVPGAGSILAAIASASGVEPIVVGKPATVLFEIAATRMGLAPEQALAVGDRLETDIAGAQAFGALTALVLSGVSTLNDARAWTPAPDLVAPSLGALLGIQAPTKHVDLQP